MRPLRLWLDWCSIELQGPTRCVSFFSLRSGASALLLLGDVGENGVDVSAAAFPGGLAALLACDTKSERADRVIG